MNDVLYSLRAFLRSLDPKLLATILSVAATYVVVDLLNVGLEDPVLGAGSLNVTWKALIALGVGAAVGYVKKNDGSLLRKDAIGDGNPDPDVLAAHRAELRVAPPDKPGR